MDCIYHFYVNYSAAASSSRMLARYQRQYGRCYCERDRAVVSCYCASWSFHVDVDDDDDDDDDSQELLLLSVLHNHRRQYCYYVVAATSIPGVPQKTDRIVPSYRCYYVSDVVAVDDDVDYLLIDLLPFVAASFSVAVASLRIHVH